MTDPLQIFLAVLFLIAAGYASGRLHQWYRYGPDRDLAYRHGYDEASQAMFEAVHRTRRSHFSSRNDMEAVR